jgi:hypothetical protein
MSVIPVDESSGTTSGAAKREGFWHRLMLALDQHFVDRAMGAVPAATLRRSKREIDQCRRLIRGAAAVPNSASLCRVARKGSGS